MNFVTLDGVTINFELTSGADQRRLIVFINSLGTDFRIWDGVLAALGNGMSVLRYDKRGHGLSSLGRTPYSIDDHADDLVRLLDHVAPEAEIVLCGLSVGGLIAQSASARLGGRVKALVLCDTGHKIGTDQSWNDRIRKVEEQGLVGISSAVLEGWFTPGLRAAQPARLEGMRAMLERQPVAGYVATCVALRDADNTRLVQSITVPTLCIVGDQDPATPPQLVRAMSDLIPGSRFDVLEGAAHIPCVEVPDVLAGRISAFLAGHGLGV